MCENPNSLAQLKFVYHSFRRTIKAMIKSTPPITHVAIKFNGKIYSLPSPNRHHHVIKMIVDVTGTDCVDTCGEDQGFLDADGNYLNRKEGLERAKATGQIRSDRPVYNQLYSENLW